MKKFIIIILMCLLLYEFPCKMAESFQIDTYICNKALHVEHTTKFKRFTYSYYIDKVIHEFEEMVVFQSKIMFDIMLK